MSADDWSDQENDAVVATYFAMLDEDLAGRRYNKAAHNRNLRQTVNRTSGSIEFKNCNISAALIGFGLPYIKGYQPRFNFQMSLAEAIARWLARNPAFEEAGPFANTNGFTDVADLFIGIAPTLRNSPPSSEFIQLEAIARKFDVARSEERRVGKECTEP